MQWYAATYGEKLRCDILKAPHHGLATIPDSFVEQTQPQVLFVPNRSALSTKVTAGWVKNHMPGAALYFSGDADFRFFGNVSTDLVGSDSEFRYRLLSRCIQDCKYFLGCGSRFSKYLWGCCVENHIQAMRILWDSFSDDEKPEWTSLEEIETFSKKMLEEEIY